MTFILILVMMTPVSGYSENSIVTFQEFNSLQQCEYAVKIIKDANPIRVRQAACIYK